VVPDIKLHFLKMKEKSFYPENFPAEVIVHVICLFQKEQYIVICIPLLRMKKNSK
jgi:hypothetical protein